MLVDTNVLIDVATEDARWLQWSSTSLTGAMSSGALAVNPVIYAEFSVQGAHAAVEELALLTRDPSRYRKYFPRIKLIAPRWKRMVPSGLAPRGDDRLDPRLELRRLDELLAYVFARSCAGGDL